MRFIRLLAVPTPVSLRGLFSYNDCEAAPEILGDWIAHGDLDGTRTLQQLSERKYRLIQQVPDPDSGNKAALDVCVAHFGGDLFFDATYDVRQPNGAELRSDEDRAFRVPLRRS